MKKNAVNVSNRTTGQRSMIPKNHPDESLKVDGLNSDGNHNEEKAVMNKTVYICNSNSELAREINAVTAA